MRYRWQACWFNNLLIVLAELVNLWLPYMAGELGELPNVRELTSNGIQTCDELGINPTAAAVGTLGGKTQGSLDPVQQWQSMGTGLPKKLVERIKAKEYIDFAELPPAKGKSRPVPQSLEGQVIMVQAADLVQSRKIIPDLATWTQCFALYMATLASHQPARLPDLMAYQSLITKASLKFKWPSWVVYDQNFRQEAAGNPHQVWAQTDPSLYAQCFTGQALSSENWCSKCQGLDHSSINCPYRPRKRSWSTDNSPGTYPSGRNEQQVCMKYNRFNGDCKFGKECCYLHVSSSCKDPHPVSKCKGNSSGLGAQGSQKPAA